jgi:hypothetical protein
LRLLDEPHDVGERRPLASTRDLHSKRSRAVHRSGDDQFNVACFVSRQVDLDEIIDHLPLTVLHNSHVRNDRAGANAKLRCARGQGRDLRAMLTSESQGR